MKITGVIWLEVVIEKLDRKHQVSQDEVEEVFGNAPTFMKMQKGHFHGEDVYRALGQTEAGRYLTVFFIYKSTKEALILSARDMDQKERKNYAKHAQK